MSPLANLLHVIPLRYKRYLLSAVLAITVLGFLEYLFVITLGQFIASITRGEGTDYNIIPDELILFDDIVSSFLIVLVALTLFRLLVSWIKVYLPIKIGCFLNNYIFSSAIKSAKNCQEGAQIPEFLSSPAKVQAFIGGVLTPFIELLSCLLIICGALMALFAMGVKIALVGILAGGGFYLIFSLYLRDAIKRYGSIFSSTQTNRMGLIFCVLKMRRVIYLADAFDFFTSRFKENERQFYLSASGKSFLPVLPRILLEPILFLVAAFAFKSHGTLDFEPEELVVVFYAFFRIIPQAQLLFHTWAKYHGSRQIIRDLGSLVRENRDENAPVFECDLDLKAWREFGLSDVTYRFNDDNKQRTPAFSKASVSVKRGENIAIIGPSGAGKSTLLDLIARFKEQTTGIFWVDDEEVSFSRREAWHRNISWVTNQEFLFKGSVAENIVMKDALKLQEFSAIREVLRVVCLDDVLSPTDIVESEGANLSAGQCQRLGLARALFQRRSLLIMDEALAALDSQTEARVLNGIFGTFPEMTIISVTHGTKFLNMFDRVLVVERDAEVEQSVDFGKSIGKECD